jgi:cysteinyl-tRNA synthetase
MKLFNTLTRTIEPLQPLKPGTIKLYTCGLTVYSQPHIGNWVGYIYWDVLVRVLEAEGNTVLRTQNITDVGHLTSDDDAGEDKMEKGARAEGKTAWDIAEKYTGIAEHEAYQLLALRRPTHLARATDFIDQQIDFAQQLEAKGYTYIIEGDGVYFDTSKLKDYGKLARLDINGLQAGARVSVAGKCNPTDFAIWKFSPKDVKRDMEWDSPWGIGFPGWHLECSVIAYQTLGEQIDIHTGGIDHIPVHHTNEIAQTESVTNKTFASTWVHNNHIKVNGQKMSKSLNNIFTLKDIAARGFSMTAFKLLVLSKHYRTEGNFTWDNLTAAQNHLMNLRSIAVLRFQPDANARHIAELDTFTESLLNLLSEDLNTVAAMALIDSICATIEKNGVPPEDVSAFNASLSSINDFMGLSLQNDADISDEQKLLISRRWRARAEGDWTTADSLRNELVTQGIGVRDSQEQSFWFPLA